MSHNSKLKGPGTSESVSKYQSKRKLKNISTFGVVSVLSASVLLACSQMSNADNGAISANGTSQNPSIQNRGVTNSRDMLP